MFSRFKNNASVVFLDPHTSEVNVTGESKTINVILSPSLYWVQRLDLDLKYLRDVRKLLPSLFEDILPEGNFNYEVFRDGSGFVAFAYEDKRIIEEINNKGINLSHVKNVYFAQTELQERVPCIVNQKEMLLLQDGLIIIAPRMWAKDEIENLSLEGLELSSKSIKLQQFSHIIDHRSLYKIGVVLSIFILILIAEIFVIESKIEDIQNQKSSVYAKHSLLRTSFQNKALYEKYMKIYKTQSKLREYLYEILNIPLQKKQKITQLSYDKKRLHVDISPVQKSKQTKIEEYLKKKLPNAKFHFKGKTFSVEVGL